MSVLGRVAARTLAVVLAGLAILGAGAQPAPAQSDPAQSDSARSDAAQSHHHHAHNHHAHNQRARTISYVALGDSYAAGQGGGNYQNDCLQSPAGYPERLDGRRHIRLQANASCSGATTTDVLTTQLGALDRHTRLVTITVGGNDLGVSSVAATCAPGPSPACSAAISAAVARLGTLGPDLGRLYLAVAAAAPKAEIVVTGYPYLFEPSGDPTITAVNNATTALNATIAGAVQAAQSQGIDIRYVDVTAAFAGHGIGSQRPFLNTTGPDAFHPNAAGYRVYAKAIAAALWWGW